MAEKPSLFDCFAKKVSCLSGSASTFAFACIIILLWAVTGPLFGFSDTWQLVINTSTTIITFLMVFVIQHTQNKDTEALQVKLDELIRAVENADNVLLDLEEMSERELDAVRDRYLKLAAEARKLAEEKQ